MATQASRRRNKQPVPPVPPTVATVPAQIAAILSQAIQPALMVAEIGRLLGTVFTAGLGAVILYAILTLIERFPMPKQIGIGAAQRHVIEMNLLRNAAFVEVSAHRMLREVNDRLARGESQSEAVSSVAAQENRYYSQHYAASAQRLNAANKIDGLEQLYGPVLGWYAVSDPKTTAECRAANGKNFSALYPPAIGWPGVVHTNCRCYPGAPYPGAGMLP